MSKPLEQRSYIQVQAWIGPSELANLQRLQAQTGATKSAVLRLLLNGELTVTPAPTNTGPNIEAERQQAH